MENLTLYQGVKTDMGKYWATYLKDTVDEKGKITYFQIEMERKDGKDKFYVHPNLIKNTKGQEGFHKIRVQNTTCIRISSLISIMHHR